jgi:hypothetical protein
MPPSISRDRFCRFPAIGFAAASETPYRSFLLNALSFQIFASSDSVTRSLDSIRLNSSEKGLSVEYHHLVKIRLPARQSKRSIACPHEISDEQNQTSLIKE